MVVRATLIWLLVPWIDPLLDPGHLVWVGVGWAIATAAFEFTFGHSVAGHSWQHLLRDYDLSAGRIWLAVLATLLAMPGLTALHLLKASPLAEAYRRPLETHLLLLAD